MAGWTKRFRALRSLPHLRHVAIGSWSTYDFEREKTYPERWGWELKRAKQEAHAQTVARSVVHEWAGWLADAKPRLTHLSLDAFGERHAEELCRAMAVGGCLHGLRTLLLPCNFGFDDFMLRARHIKMKRIAKLNARGSSRPSLLCQILSA